MPGSKERRPRTPIARASLEITVGEIHRNDKSSCFHRRPHTTTQQAFERSTKKCPRADYISLRPSYGIKESLSQLSHTDTSFSLRVEGDGVLAEYAQFLITVPVPSADVEPAPLAAPPSPGSASHSSQPQHPSRRGMRVNKP